MSIPSFKAQRKPILTLLADGNTWKKSDLIAPLAQHFGLTDEETARKYPSGNGSIFADRISWTLSYCVLSGLLSRPQRGHYVITELGKTFADKSDAEINAHIKRQMNRRAKTQRADNEHPPANDSDATPQEQLYAAYEAIRQGVYDEILDTILSKTPMAFERLVVELLQKMGYGGAVEKAGKVSRYIKDGGIDGEIYEDVLGLGRIHIQAKRYQRDKVIGRPDIQSFAGALLGSHANKGVFITTARYSTEARDYADNLPNARIVLIDGQKLAEYLYHYGLGVQVEQTFSIKKPDNDYWDEMPDDGK